MKNSVSKGFTVHNKFNGLFLLSFFVLGFILKVLSEFIHEVLGHGLFVLLANGRIRGIKISLLWPLELSHISTSLPDGITPLEIALIEAGGIIACSITFFISLLTLIRIKPDRWLYSTCLVWLAFWCLMNSAGYLVIGGLSPFGDIYRLINLGVLTRSISFIIGLGLFCCGFVIISIKLKQILYKWYGNSAENSVIAFWSLVPLLTFLAIIGNDFQVMFVLPSFLPMIISFFPKLTMTSEAITFLTDEEYENIFFDFCSLRNKIGMKLIKYGLLEKENVLDIAAGHGLLSIAIKEHGYNNKLVAIGLKNDVESFGQLRKKYDSVKDIQYVECFSSQLGFKNESFDCIINFLGLEDINMTSGKRGVKKTLFEMSRIVKKEGIIEITIQIEGKEPSSQIFWDLWENIGLNSIFYPPDYYIDTLESVGCFLVEQFSLKTYKKMTENQAKLEIKFACDEAPKIFSDYDVEARPFQEVWKEFKPRIRKYGMEFWPEFLVLIFKKEECEI